MTTDFVRPHGVRRERAARRAAASKVLPLLPLAALAFACLDGVVLAAAGRLLLTLAGVR